ncbi:MULTISPECIES: nucleobase:cation symporter-2 family protein [unclassified Shinella]|uniref:nucleobase:cation symporter-2 family protein n=1 Tax=unclassified Shinella TaxID=2643062 RepID=UPI00225CAF9C|nr:MULTISPECIES: nucleobase:cation symporter-2 family protein [unclassified Shinella]MCO5139039.1 purine permease [Shinella sp.]MDC7256232.1 purine permease [Shinella sp. YE25]CAI0339086.1 Uric acid transporter UacT [Rhizobiaceae bacterium]CAK7257505.1 Uric acid transporter UacT [Shinella sp. WSC3-e]
MAVFALQHVLVMYTGAIAVPFIIGGALNLTQAQIAYLIQADLITCGLATLIQTVGFWRFGVRMPLMQGITFAAISPVIAIGNNPAILADGPNAGLQAVYGAVIAAGLFAIFMAPRGRYIVRAFPPVVVGAVLTVMGLSLLPVAIQYAAGGFMPDAGRPAYIGLAFLVLAVIVLLNMFGRGFVKNISVFLGLVVGVVFAAVMGMLDFSAVKDAAPVAIVTPFHFGMPTFHLVPVLTMCLVVAITWVESVGDTIAVGEMVGRPATERTIADLLRADGLSTMLGGMLNSFPYTAFSENVALVNITGMRSRWTVALAGGFLIVLGLSPVLATAIASLPKPVVGGAGFVMFGTLVVVGMKTLQKIDFDTTFNNFMVVGLSVAMAMITIVKPDFFQFMPDWSQVVFHSPVIMGAVTAIAMNAALNGLSMQGQIAMAH